MISPSFPGGRRGTPLGVALAASLLLHLALLGPLLKGLPAPKPATPPTRTHEVRLAPPPGPPGGSTATAEPPSRQPRPPERAAPPPESRPPDRPEKTPVEPAPKPAAGATEPSSSAAASDPPTEPGAPAAPLELFPSARDTARWDAESARRGTDLRRKRVAPHSRDDRLGAYVSAWLRKVERVGNNNYPEEARRRGIHGAVRVEAVLRPDGSLAGVRILESSGEEVLDEAARRIIRLGAPYAPLGPELGRRLDRLHIPHRFVFTEGDPLRATP